MEVIRIDGNPVSVRIGEQEFECDEETGYTTIPKVFLAEFRLSDISADITVKPVEKIEGHVIHIKNDVALHSFSDGSATASVEMMFRRKFWDGDIGLSPYVTALRQAIDEADEASETDFQDDGDYIFVYYDITITEDFKIREAMDFVEALIEGIETRTDQLVSRRHDGLTGIFDRSSFDADLNHATSGKHPVALLMADIDHFKNVNDKHGHPVGDEVLRAVARTLANKCDGRTVVPYRYGGEELSLIITGEEAANGAEVAESIRSNVEELRIEAHPDLKVTISLGVAAAHDTGRDSQELVKRADAALYEAKRDGRNRVRQSK
jgi:diguanylate cyclase (GGDEF)-like protein